MVTQSTLLLKQCWVSSRPIITVNASGTELVWWTSDRKKSKSLSSAWYLTSQKSIEVTMILIKFGSEPVVQSDFLTRKVFDGSPIKPNFRTTCIQTGTLVSPTSPIKINTVWLYGLVLIILETGTIIIVNKECEPFVSDQLCTNRKKILLRSQPHYRLCRHRLL